MSPNAEIGRVDEEKPSLIASLKRSGRGGYCARRKVRLHRQCCRKDVVELIPRGASAASGGLGCVSLAGYRLGR